MRVFVCLLLACLAIGAYGAALDNLNRQNLERALLIDLLEARSGGSSKRPECEDDDDLGSHDWPRHCGETDHGPCTCTLACVFEDDEYKEKATPIDGGECPPPRPPRPPPCDQDRDPKVVDYPKNCVDAECTCTLTCAEVTESGETEWEWSGVGTDCPDHDDKRDMLIMFFFLISIFAWLTFLQDLLESRSGGGSGRPKPNDDCDEGEPAHTFDHPKDCTDNCETCTLTCTADDDDPEEFYWKKADNGCPDDHPGICAVQEFGLTIVHVPSPPPQPEDGADKRGRGGDRPEIFEMIRNWYDDNEGGVPLCDEAEDTDIVCVHDEQAVFFIFGGLLGDIVFDMVDNECE
ncbi:uncharacterized protein [Amphiura filiformis]|uniref:uncharacterized protein n=1 Tax=Amphiura filiformis TaxID=82378 RepID=UPI003B21B491